MAAIITSDAEIHTWRVVGESSKVREEEAVYLRTLQHNIRSTLNTLTVIYLHIYIYVFEIYIYIFKTI